MNESTQIFTQALHTSSSNSTSDLPTQPTLLPSFQSQTQSHTDAAESLDELHHKSTYTFRFCIFIRSITNRKLQLTRERRGLVEIWRDQRDKFDPEPTFPPAEMASVSELQNKLEKIVRSHPELERQAAKGLEETIAALEKTSVSTEAPPSVPSLPEDPIGRLGRGFQTFKANHFDKETALFEKLKTGQWPKYMIVACSDSRVDPATILGLQPGEAFMVRNVANLVPAWEKGGYPSVSSALEYAVKHLKVEHIVVIGHRLCGGIKALVTTEEGQGSHDFIENWIEIGQPARAVTKNVCNADSTDDQCKFCEKESVNVSLTNLLTFPWVKEKVIAKKLSLHGGFYDFVEGSFQVWDLDVAITHSQKF